MFASTIRAAAVVAFAMVTLVPAGRTLADEMTGVDPGAAMQPVRTAAAASVVRTAKLGLNKSLIVDLPRDARDVLVSNPKIADAVIRTPRRIYLTGVAVGQTDIIVFDRAGNQIVALDLQVERGANQLAPILSRLIPGSSIAVEIVNDNVVLSGTVRNAADARKAVDIAEAFANGGANSQTQAQLASTGATSTPTAGGAMIVTTGSSTTQQVATSSVINLLAIEGEDQVHLKVTVAEVERSLVKQLGIDWDANGLSVGSLILNAATDFPFAVKGAGPATFAGLGNQEGTLGVTLRALEQSGLYRTLAEPTLTAISGESASFLAGGEFPVPVGRDSDGNVTIAYKPFGVALTFSPVVMSEDRISLRVKTEVSELSQEGAIQLQDISLPSLKVRRAEATLELPSGGSMVLGGLLQDNVRQSLAGLPGLRNLPILGTLFRSRDFQRNETELVIMVTPYLVKSVSRSALARPDQGFSAPSDTSANFLGQLNRVYGGNGAGPAGTYQGGVGYIIE
jgi:pilus assembly protein CpaC